MNTRSKKHIIIAVILTLFVFIAFKFGYAVLNTPGGFSFFPSGETVDSNEKFASVIIENLSKNNTHINIYHKTETPLLAEDIISNVPGIYAVNLSSVKVIGGYNYSIDCSGWDNYAISYAYNNNDLTYLSDQQKILLNKYIEIYNSVTSPSKTLYENELAIHDYLVENIVYTKDVSSDHAYNALFNGIALCSGYTECFKTFMDMMGIENTAITGIAGDENHIWNEVKLDGNWYQVDVTWDDPSDDYDNTEHIYFNVTDSDMTLDHTFETSQLGYHPASSTDYSYVNKSNVRKISTQDELSDYITDCIKSGKASTEFYSEYDLLIDSNIFWNSKTNITNFAYLKVPRDKYIMYSILFIEK